MRSIDRASLDGLRSELESIFLNEDASLLLDGTGGGALYFVASGRLEIIHVAENQASAASDDAQVLATLIPGDVVSEMRSLTGDEGSAAGRAVTDACLVKLAKAGFDRYLATHPDVTTKLRSIFSPRFYHSEMTRVLGSMFGDLTEDLLADIEQRLTWRHVAREDVLARPGDPSPGLLVVVSGRLRQLIEDGADSKFVSDVVEGEAVGATSVYADRPQTTTVVAVRDSVLLEFSRDSFRELSLRYPRLNEWLARLLSLRLHGAINQTPDEHLGTNILVIPANQGAPVENFARRFSGSLSQHASCALLTSAGTDALLDTTGIAQAPEGSSEDLRLRAWLNEQETRCNYTVYLADSTLTNWTKRCIQQADEVMAIGLAAASPDLTEVEMETLRREGSRRAKSRITLVLLHSQDTERPQRTQAWLRERPIDRHFHIRDGDSEELDRIVRFVTRREIGLVLSGGGARGFAHVGVIRAVREAGLPVDVVAGTSIGAAYASSGDFVAMVQSLAELLKGAFNDYTLPLVSLTRGRRFDHVLKTVFGDANIEDLWLPYFCVSSNMTRADTVVHRSGPLWWALRATGSLPGLVTPVVHNGELLYDGCLLNNLPMDLMREEIKTGSLVAVDVVPPVDADFGATATQSPSGWRIAWNRINPFSNEIRLPGIVPILQRAGTLGSIYNRQQMIRDNIADLYIQPPVEQFNILDFSVADEAMEIGYVSGAAEIAAWAGHDR